MRIRSLAPVVVGAACLLLAACEQPTTAPAVTEQPSRVTNGELDGAAHPAVVLLLMEVGGKPAWRCSGTLVTPTVVLTAGHCTGEPREVSGIRIFTESDVENGDNSYPYRGRNSVEARAWASHPAYTNAAFYLHDVGMIRLAKAVDLPAAAYGKLPTRDQLDALKPSNSTRFTAVGYGLQKINPAQVENDLIRMKAEPHLLQINTGFTGDFSVLLSNNAHTGGTCFGDSGGPNFIGSSNVVGGVTSFGINGNCAGTGGVYRVDRSDALNWLTTTFGSHLR